MEKAQTETLDHLSAVNAAFDLAIKNCGGKQRMLAALSITDSWMYALRKGHKMTVTMALKLQTLTRGKHPWGTLCPYGLEEISSVEEFLTDDTE